MSDIQQGLNGSGCIKFYYFIIILFTGNIIVCA